MAIGDTSLARYQFYDIQKRREELEEERKSRYQTVARGASDLWKMYTSEQAIKSKELLSFDERLEMDPEYLKKGFLGRSFTPAGGRIRPVSGQKLELEELLELQELQGTEKFSQYFTGPLKRISKSIGIDSPGKKAFEGAVRPGDLPSKPEIAGVSTGAKVLGGIGAVTGLYDLATNWEEYKKTPEGQTKAFQRGLQTVGSALTATGVGAGIGVPLTLGATLWDWLT